jgi:hypothetical protein
VTPMNATSLSNNASFWSKKRYLYNRSQSP